MHQTKMLPALLFLAAITAAAAQQPVASTDVDTPTPLTTKTVSGKGVKSRVSYFYGFAADAGTVILTGTGKNAPSGMANALGAEVLTATNADKLCDINLGNTNQDKTETANCSVDKAQPLILRIDLDEETIDYKVELAGPVKLAAAGTATAAAQPAAGAGSTDIDAPTPMSGPTVRGVGTKQMTSYYYSFNAGPGEFRIIADGKNEPVGVAQALQLRVMNLRSEEICEVNLGNVTRDAREIATCRLDKRESLILRVNIDPNTIDWRARVDGAVDFDPYTPPKVITIALNEQVLFDSGEAVLKPESRQTLHEAAVRVKKFPTAVVTVAGHTDNVGGDAANLKLSEARAAAVKDFFVQQESIPAARLAVKGHGKTMPVAENTTAEGRARNRRVEVVIAPQ
jgi:outer membrane protein OmpA-like peptidoglycan-associated protein